jgi:hypothetical protein
MSINSFWVIQSKITIWVLAFLTPNYKIQVFALKFSILLIVRLLIFPVPCGICLKMCLDKLKRGAKLWRPAPMSALGTTKPPTNAFVAVASHEWERGNADWMRRAPVQRIKHSGRARAPISQTHAPTERCPSRDKVALAKKTFSPIVMRSLLFMKCHWAHTHTSLSMGWWLNRIWFETALCCSRSSERRCARGIGF